MLISAVQQCESAISISRSVVSNSLRPHGNVACQAPLHRISQARTLDWVAVSLLLTQGSYPGILLGRQTLLSQPPGKPPVNQLYVHPHPLNPPSQPHNLTPPGHQSTKLSSQCYSATLHSESSPLIRAWWATVHRVTKSRTQLRRPSTHAQLYRLQVFSVFSFS